jgi:hypothetical protein
MSEWLTRVLPTLSRGWASFHNESISALLMHAQLLARGVVDPRVTSLALPFGLAVGGITAWRVTRLDPGEDPGLGIAAWITAMPLISSFTEQHHMMYTWIPLAIVLAHSKPWSRPWWFMGVAWALMQLAHEKVDDFGASIGLLQSSPLHILGFLLLSSLFLVGAILAWLSVMGALEEKARNALVH